MVYEKIDLKKIGSLEIHFKKKIKKINLKTQRFIKNNKMSIFLYQGLLDTGRG